MTSRHALFVLCFVLLAGSLWPVSLGNAAAQTPEALPTVVDTPNDCDFLVQSANDPRPELGAIHCGTVNVPENWTEPEGRRIDLGYVVLEATGDDPQADPIIYLAGGPGTSPLTRIDSWARVFAPLREDRDIIFFDQRGARLSSPLRCEDESAILGVDLPPEVMEAAGVAPAGPPADVADLDAEALLVTAREQFSAAAQACVEKLTAQGIDLSQYNTLANATDVVALAQALGYDTFDLYAVSYGTRLALEVMRSHPDSGVRSVVLDSTYPPEVKSYEQFPLEPHEVVTQLFADCQRDPACNAAYPELQTRFVALLEQLHLTPIERADGATLTDRDLIALMQSLAGNLPAVPYVPAMIAELERGETGTFDGIVSGALFAENEVEASPVAMDAEATPIVDPFAGFTPARQLVLNLEAAAGENAMDLLRQLDRGEATRDALEAAIASQTDPELSTALAALSDAEIAQVFGVIEQELTLQDLFTVGGTPAQYYSVECNERIPFQSLAGMVSFAQGMAIPELSLGVPETFAKVFAICESWTSGTAPAWTQEPVWSSIPTLIYAGAYDNVTPVSWNKSAFQTLANATFVVSPMAAHGVIIYSTCAKDVAVAFLADPYAPLDTSCFADLAPDWVLPG